MARCLARVVTGSTLLIFLAAPPPAAANIWNPFDGLPEKPSIEEKAQGALQQALAGIEAIVGRVVSRFKIPDPSFIGIRGREDYRPATDGPVSFRNALSPLRFALKSLTVPTPAPSDQPSRGTPCGKDPGDARWADDCSCRCGERCPGNPTLSCEECKEINRGDRLTTQADCRLLHRHEINKEGGEPTGRFHF